MPSSSSSKAVSKVAEMETLTRFAAPGTLSRNAGEGGPGPQGWVGEGSLPEPLAVYIHWPFCRSKCPYCDFNSHVRDSIDAALWAREMLIDLLHTDLNYPGLDV